MATETQRQRLLADIGADAEVFTVAELDELFSRAAETYPSGGEAVVFACARVLAVRQLIARLVPQLVKYRQGESTEDRTPVLTGLQAMLKLYEDELSDALNAEQGGTIRWGRLARRNPTRDREFPNE